MQWGQQKLKWDTISVLTLQYEVNCSKKSKERQNHPKTSSSQSHFCDINASSQEAIMSSFTCSFFWMDQPTRGHGQKVCCISQHSLNMSSTWSRYQETKSEDDSRQATAQQQDQAIIVFMRGGKREAPPECNNTVSTRQSKTAQLKQTRCPETSALYFSIATNTYMSKPAKKQQTSWLAVISKPQLIETENHKKKNKKLLRTTVIASLIFSWYQNLSTTVRL